MSLKMTNNPFTHVLSWRINVEAQNTFISNNNKINPIIHVLQKKKKIQKEFETIGFNNIIQLRAGYECII